jgi:hypothetical protein
MNVPTPRPGRKHPVRKRVEFIGHIGFRRRQKWSMPFTVAAYRVTHIEMAVAR